MKRYRGNQAMAKNKYAKTPNQWSTSDYKILWAASKIAKLMDWLTKEEILSLFSQGYDVNILKIEQKTKAAQEQAKSFSEQNLIIDVE